MKSSDSRIPAHSIVYSNDPHIADTILDPVADPNKFMERPIREMFGPIAQPIAGQTYGLAMSCNMKKVREIQEKFSRTLAQEQIAYAHQHSITRHKKINKVTGATITLNFPSNAFTAKEMNEKAGRANDYATRHSSAPSYSFDFATSNREEFELIRDKISTALIKEEVCQSPDQFRIVPYTWNKQHFIGRIEINFDPSDAEKFNQSHKKASKFVQKYLPMKAKAPEVAEELVPALT